MNDARDSLRPDTPADFVIWIALAGIGAAVCRWFSDVTAGPEYGGTYDVPVVNSVMWFAFVAFAAAALIGFVGGALRLFGALWLRVAARRR